jgi:hypothetical protein
MRKHAVVILILSLLTGAQLSYTQDQKVEIQQRLASLFTLTKITADRSDIVAPGSILVLHKDGVIMFRLDAKIPSTMTYKDGKLSKSFGDAMTETMFLGGNQTASNTPQRRFVSGEKFWITAYSVTDKNVILQIYSDPYGNDRYYGQIKVPFSKHNIPPADDLMKTIAEVVTVEPPDTAANNQAAQPNTAPPEPTKNISLGQTKAEVVAIFGQPQRVAFVGAKEIDYFPNIKVTLVNGKVVDVE